PPSIHLSPSLNSLSSVLWASVKIPSTKSASPKIRAMSIEPFLRPPIDFFPCHGWHGSAVLPPKILKPIRCQFGVAHRVLNIAMPKVGLQGPCVVAGIGEGEAAGVPEHVRVRLQIEAGFRTDAANPVGFVAGPIGMLGQGRKKDRSFLGV